MANVAAMASGGFRGGSTEAIAELHDEIQHFESQRRADKRARFQVVIRIGLRSTVAGLLVHILGIIAITRPQASLLFLEYCSTLGQGMAIVVFIVAPGFDFDDFFHRRPVARRCIWVATLLQSLRVLRQPLAGASTGNLSAASTGLVLTVLVALVGVFSCPDGDGPAVHCPSMTMLTNAWCACFRAGQTLWFLLQGVGCEDFDFAMSVCLPACFILMYLAAQCYRSLRRQQVGSQGASRAWPLNLAVFWLSYNHLVSGREILTGLLISRKPDCMSFDSRDWQHVCIYGALFLLPHLVLLASGHFRLHWFLTQAVSSSFLRSDTLVGFGTRIATASIFMMSLRTLLVVAGPTTSSYITGPSASLWYACGVVIMSTCPPEDLDLDRLFVERPNLQGVIGVVAAAYCVLLGLKEKTPLYAVPSFIMLFVGISSRRWCRECSRICRRPIDASCIAWPSKLLADIPSFRATRARCSSYAISSTVVFSAVVFTLVIVVIVLRTLHCLTDGRRGATPTLTLYINMYFAMTLWGVLQVADGIAVFAGCTDGTSPDTGGAIARMLMGLADVTPVVLVLTIGRKKLFHFTARRFDCDPMRAQRDGAFLASLLDCASRIQAGDAFWIHHGRDDDAYPLYDAKRNWDLGEVVSVDEDSFVVKTTPPARTRRSVRQRSFFSTVPSLRSTRSSGGSAVYHRLPMAAREMTVEDMLAFARKELRCIDWQNISRELMSGSKSDPDAPDTLSRPLRKGEVIDYFMSHSWHDDADAKWAKLQEVASQFERRHRRSPTFWLDKVCIDQRNIADGLKVLPVNVMACRQVLVLCGATYPDRLWCIWEICVVFSFACKEQALKRLRFEVLGTHTKSAVLERLQQFEAKNSRCYDPNEQAKLFQVISTIGADQFDAQIQRLAGEMELRFGEQSLLKGASFQFDDIPSTSSTSAALIGLAAEESVGSTASVASSDSPSEIEVQV
eukprot:TRINITY_DN4210_c0_g2_i1.p1 TRINITY_DN4210_c0_g2~~TRINITY_DN4210_c0_g2_i1.p1  ORF type:complete len:960 (+),score=74.73 TRINITY_DN4210_c0_g2_i1:75-2954(+)